MLARTTRPPKPSPRMPVYYAHHDDSRPFENASEYFPPMSVINPSPAAMASTTHDARVPLQHAPHSIAVLQTGQLPPLPSPGSTRRPHHGRPKYPRHNTASPTTLTGGINSAILRYEGAPLEDPISAQVPSVTPLFEQDLRPFDDYSAVSFL